jgi:hypothetical protein
MNLCRLAGFFIKKYAQSFKISLLKDVSFDLKNAAAKLQQHLDSSKRLPFWAGMRDVVITRATLQNAQMICDKCIRDLEKNQVQGVDECMRWLPGILSDLLDISNRDEFKGANVSRELNSAGAKLRQSQSG